MDQTQINLIVEYAFRVCENHVDASNDSTTQGIPGQVIVPDRATLRASLLNIFVLQCKQEYYILVCTIMLIGMYADERF